MSDDSKKSKDSPEDLTTGIAWVDREPLAKLVFGVIVVPFPLSGVCPSLKLW